MGLYIGEDLHLIPRIDGYTSHCSACCNHAACAQLYGNRSSLLTQPITEEV
jgi:hypothetical protein